MSPQEIRTAIRETQAQLAKLPERSPAYAALLDHMRALLKLELLAIQKPSAVPMPESVVYPDAALKLVKR
jgi:hypothetical protein